MRGDVKTGSCNVGLLLVRPSLQVAFPVYADSKDIWKLYRNTGRSGTIEVR